jgi:hypothetical protein
MRWVALALWLITAGGGMLLGTQWLRHGGTTQETGIRLGRLASHAGAAVLGLVAWIGFLATDSTGLAWTAVGLLAVVAALGIGMLVIWLRGRSGTSHTSLPAEASFPVPVVLGHGVLAVATVAASVIAALTA